MQKFKCITYFRITVGMSGCYKAEELCTYFVRSMVCHILNSYVEHSLISTHPLSVTSI